MCVCVHLHNMSLIVSLFTQRKEVVLHFSHHFDKFSPYKTVHYSLGNFYLEPTGLPYAIRAELPSTCNSGLRHTVSHCYIHSITGELALNIDLSHITSPPESISNSRTLRVAVCRNSCIRTEYHVPFPTCQEAAHASDSGQG